MKTYTGKRLALVLLSLLMTAVLLASCANPKSAADESKIKLTFSQKTLTGEKIDDSIVSNNKLTMVNYWATWCGPCVGEIPDLQKIGEEYAEKGFSIIGVLLGDEDYDGARKFLSDNDITYPVVLPEGVFLDMASGISAIPTTMFFDADGYQVGETQVGSMSYEDWASLIDSLLEQVAE